MRAGPQHPFPFIFHSQHINEMRGFGTILSLSATFGYARTQLLGTGSLVGLGGPQQTLDYGTFQGLTDTGTGTDNFLGMPFAIAGRLENPRVINVTDKIAGVQDATKYGAACPQQEFVSSPLNANQPNSEVGGLLAVAELLLAQNITDQSEDCLSINVQVPHGYKAGDNLPVMMWIYGGGFELGSSAALGSEATAFEGDIYQGANIVARSVQMGQPVVFVSANYRLNAFGGLASQEIKDAGVSNLMLKDQRVAMQWVQRYIANFGGDPTKVTIFGESAGSISIAIHMLLNNGDPEGLFSSAIMLSGGPSKFLDYHKGQQTFDTVAAAVGCGNSAAKVQCIRDAPYDALYTAVQKMPNFLSYESTAVPWYPRPDGDYLVDSPSALLRTGNIADIPFIIGDMKVGGIDTWESAMLTNLQVEGTLFSLVNQLNISNDADFQEYFNTIFFPQLDAGQVEALTSLYPEDPASGSPFDTGDLNQLGPEYKRLAALVGDYTFQAPRRDLLNLRSGLQNAWTYQIVNSAPIIGQSTILGASGLDVAQLPVLGSFHASDVTMNVFAETPATISKNTLNIMSTFISFANTHDPNNHGLSGLPYWPKYNTSNRTMFQFEEDGPKLITDDFRQAAIDQVNDNWATYMS